MAQLSSDDPSFELLGPNPALFTDEKHQIYVSESPALDPGPEDCVVHVRCNGVCGYVLPKIIP